MFARLNKVFFNTFFKFWSVKKTKKMERTYTFTDCELAELILDFQDAEDMDYDELVESLNDHLRYHE